MVSIKKSKISSDANELLDTVDTKIKSLALGKFVIRKSQRLKALGKTREEINKTIEELIETINKMQK